MDNRELMKQLLHRAKQLAPHRVPKPDPELVDVWAQTVKLDRFPPKLWGDAVVYWAESTQDFLDVGVLKRCAYSVRDAWEADPVKREILQQRRNAYLSHRVNRGELPPQCAPKVREIESQHRKTATEEQTRDQLRALMEEIKQKRWENATDHERAKQRAKKEKQQRRFEEEARNRELAEQLKQQRKETTNGTH